MTNFERLQREAQITDPADPNFNSDMDVIVAFTRRPYRDAINEGIDPNDSKAFGDWIQAEQEKAIREVTV